MKLADIGKPKPKSNEILVKNYAATVTIADCRVRGFNVPASLWLFAKAVFAFTEHNFGAYAEYVCINGNSCVAIKPNNISFEQAKGNVIINIIE